jgi:hypothetical protein
MMSSKGQAPGRVTPWMALGLTHVQVGFKMASPRLLSAVFPIELLAKMPRVSFPSVHGGDHTTNVVR